jgi:hypothetical protein
MLEVWEEEFFDEAGQPNERFKKLSNMVSVYRSGPVNLNKAPPDVLELLALEGGYNEDYLFDGLEQPYLTQAPASVDTASGGVEIDLLRVTVSLIRGNVPYTVSALVEPNFNTESAGGGSAPGRRGDEESPRTGSEEEQAAIRYPFNILQLSEYDAGELNSPQPARYSALDMEEELETF